MAGSRKTKTVEPVPTPEPQVPEKRSKHPRAESSEPQEKKPVTYPSLDEDGTLSLATVDLTNMESIMTAFKRSCGFMRTMVTTISRLSESAHSLYSRSVREALRKKSRRPQDPSKPARLSTFTYRCVVRPEVNEFMGNPKGTFVSRVELSKAVSKYINEHNLKKSDGNGGHTISRDSRLNLVLEPSIEHEGKKVKTVTHRLLQKFLNWNYGDKAPDAAQPDPEVLRAESLKRKEERRAAGRKRDEPEPAPVAPAPAESEPEAKPAKARKPKTK